MSIVSPYRSDVAIGKLTINGKEFAVYPSDFAVRWLNEQLLTRLGGMDELTLSQVAELVLGALATPSTDARANETATSIDELRNELSSLRSDCDTLRGVIADQEAAILSLRSADDLRTRVEQLEDRFV